MDGNSDYLTLWTHYESRGFDDKNRMIATASLLIGFAGAMLGASIGSLGPSLRIAGCGGDIPMTTADAIGYVSLLRMPTLERIR